MHDRRPWRRPLPAGWRLCRSWTSSTPITSPRPRTSPIRGCLFASWRRPSSNSAPRAAALAIRFSARIVRRTARPAAVEIGLPAVVVMVSPRGSFITSLGPIAADSGRPPPSALPYEMRSGTMPSTSKAWNWPVRPTPTLTSSQIRRMPWRRQISDRPLRKPGGGTTSPPSHIRASRNTPADLRRRRYGRQQILEIVEHRLDDVARKGRPVGVGIGQVDLARMGARDGVELERVVAGDGEAGAEPAMGPADEGDEAPAPGRGGDRAHDRLVGIRAAMAEPDAAVGIARDQRQEVLGQRHRLRVGRADVTRRGEAGHRLGDRVSDRRVIVAERRSAPGAREVEDALAALVDQIAALAADDRQRKNRIFWISAITLRSRCSSVSGILLPPVLDAGMRCFC